MRLTAPGLAAAALAGLLAATASFAPALADSAVNYCIDRCFSSFRPPPDCSYCTASRDACVKQCSKTAHSYGAIAYGATSGAWGTSYQWQTRAKAESVAMENCKAHGNDCEVQVWFEHNCGAVVTDDGDGIYWGLGDGEGLARKSALDKCAQAGGKGCEVQVATCSR